MFYIHILETIFILILIWIYISDISTQENALISREVDGLYVVDISLIYLYKAASPKKTCFHSFLSLETRLRQCTYRIDIDRF